MESKISIMLFGENASKPEDQEASKADLRSTDDGLRGTGNLSAP